MLTQVTTQNKSLYSYSSTKAALIIYNWRQYYVLKCSVPHCPFSTTPLYAFILKALWYAVLWRTHQVLTATYTEKEQC